MEKEMAAAIGLIGGLKAGDQVVVAYNGRTAEYTVSRGPWRSGGPESVRVALTLNGGQLDHDYSFEVSAQDLVRTGTLWMSRLAEGAGVAAGRTRTCPVPDCAEHLTGWERFLVHIYEEHTSGTEDERLVQAAGGVSRWDTAERLLSQGLATEAADSPQPLPQVRHDCAFCGRERTPRDDNHAPQCCYWDFFGGQSA